MIIHAWQLAYNGMCGGRPLQYTEAEVMAVSQLINGTAWIGQEAKKERLREAVTTQRWIHMACHGWFKP